MVGRVSTKVLHSQLTSGLLLFWLWHSGNTAVSLTGSADDGVAVGGNFLLHCKPVGFSLGRADNTKWYHNSRLISKEIYHAIYDNHNTSLSATANANTSGSYQCEQANQLSNFYIVSLIQGIAGCLLSINLSVNLYAHTDVHYWGTFLILPK